MLRRCFSQAAEIVDQRFAGVRGRDGSTDVLRLFAGKIGKRTRPQAVLLPNAEQVFSQGGERALTCYTYGHGPQALGPVSL